MVILGASESPKYPADEGWVMWAAPPGPPEPLELWWQRLNFEAVFPDGTGLSTAVNIKCDPSLTLYQGFVLGMSSVDGITYELTFQEGTVYTDPDGWALAEELGDVVTFAVPAGEVLVEFDHIPHTTIFAVTDQRGRQLLEAADMAALLESYAVGMCDECDDPNGECPETCLVSTLHANGEPPAYLADPPQPPYLPFALLVDATGQVLYGNQLDPTSSRP